MLKSPGTSTCPASSATTPCLVSPAVQPIWTWSVVSNAINPAFSQPQVPLVGPWTRGPPMSQVRSAIRATLARTTLLIGAPPYPLPLQPGLRHKQLLDQVGRAPPRRLRREIDHEPVREHRRGHGAEIVLVRHGPTVQRRARLGAEDQVLRRARARPPRPELLDEGRRLGVGRP